MVDLMQGLLLNWGNEGEITALNYEQEAPYPSYRVLAEIMHVQASHSPLSATPGLRVFLWAGQL